ncbi:MAG: hypothetical protein JSV80_01185, partial [Acidobacteriota bacterium]
IRASLRSVPGVVSVRVVAYSATAVHGPQGAASVNHSQGKTLLIGAGEVGRRLAGALERAGWGRVTVSRESGWDVAERASDEAPRLIGVREHDLAAVLERLSQIPRERLILVQNGFLEAVHGDLGPVTRGLIWFTSKGDFFAELTPSLFFGPLAVTLASALSSGALRAAAIDEREEFLRQMILKGVWNAVVGLPLAVHGVDLGTYLESHAEELHALTGESAAAASAHYGVSVSGEQALACLRETTTPIHWVRGGAKALAWRNGALARFGRAHGVATPVNDRLLRAVGYDPDDPPPPGP